MPLTAWPDAAKAAPVIAAPSGGFACSHRLCHGAPDGPAAAGSESHPARWRRATRPASRRWLASGIIAAGAGLLPWIIYLAVSLPASPRAWHWPVAWAGVDALEATGLLATGLLLLRRDVRCCLTALPTAGLLLADAWFDVMTAPPGRAVLAPLAMAIGAELPGSALCLAVGIAGLRRLLADRQPRPN